MYINICSKRILFVCAFIHSWHTVHAERSDRWPRSARTNKNPIAQNSWIVQNLATGVTGNLAVIWQSNDIGLLTKTRLWDWSASAISTTVQCWHLNDDRRDWAEVTCFRDGSPEMYYNGNQYRWDRWRNVDIRKDLGINRDVVNQVRSRRRSYFGHVVRMAPNHIPNIMLYGRVHGKRPIGRPKNTGSNMSETTAKSWVSL